MDVEGGWPAAAAAALAMAASCVAAALLDHGPLAPVSSATANHARMPPSMQLILLEDSIAQSSASVLREMLLRAEERYVYASDPVRLLL